MVAPRAGSGEGIGAGPCSACHLDDLVFCSALAEDERPRLAAIVNEVRADSGQTIFFEGDPARHVFNVTEGAVKLYKLMADGRRQITGFLFRGDFLGVALNTSYAYTAEALTAARLCRFDRTAIEKLLNEFPRIERRLLEMAGNELVAAQDQMLLLGRKTALERIVSLLILLADRAERRGEPASPVNLPMTRSDIADYLGLTTETVSRAFTELRKDGLIVLDRPDTVRLVRREALDAIASGEGGG
jgi:CRP/FNR family transcriptional regulator